MSRDECRWPFLAVPVTEWGVDHLPTITVKVESGQPTFFDWFYCAAASLDYVALAGNRHSKPILCGSFYGETLFCRLSFVTGFQCSVCVEDIRSALCFCFDNLSRWLFVDRPLSRPLRGKRKRGADPLKPLPILHPLAGGSRETVWFLFCGSAQSVGML